MPTIYPALNLPHAWHLIVKYDQDGQEAVNVLGGRSTDGGWGGTATDPQAQLDAWWDAIKGIVDSGVKITEAYARQAVSEGYVVGLTAPSTTGSQSGSSFAAGAMLAKWSTIGFGRGARGRTFIPGVPLSNVAGDGRTLLSTFNATAQTALTSYLTALDTGGIVTPCVLSRSDGADWDITSVTVPAQIAIQRRRMRS